jgi:hypothetical protein
MKLLHHSWVVISVLLVIVLSAVTFLIVKPALAQVDATSIDHLEISTTTALDQGDVSASSSSTDATVTDGSNTTGAAAAVESATPTDMAPSEPPPQGLVEVHIIGTKYIDYFTDGTTITAYPGDPEIDGNLNKPDAPIPTHEGLTWVHTTGGYLYDTESGDLDVGEYAVQPNATYITNAPPFVSSTSTPADRGESVSTEVTPPDTSSTSPTTSDSSIDTTAPTTTPTESTTTLSDQ